MPKFSANLGLLWPQLPLLDRVRAAARAGFRAVEFHWPYDTPAHELQVCCQDSAVAILGINTAVGDAWRGERGVGAVVGREAEFRETFLQALEYCNAIGGTAIHVMAGNVLASEYQRGKEVFIGNLDWALRQIKGGSISLLLEPLNLRDNPGYFYSRQSQAVEIIEALAHPQLKLQFDVYHVGVTEGDVLAKLRQHRAHIGNIQIAAVPSRAEPDEGEIDYRGVFDRIDVLQYSGWVGCEYRPRGATDQGLVWLNRFGVDLRSSKD